MKKHLLILAFFASISAFAEEVTTNLVVWAKDGSKVAYALAEKPKVTFTEADLIIKTENIEISYELAQMKSLTYEKTKTPTQIINVSGEPVKRFKFTGESLVFSASNSVSVVKIYSADGKLVLNKTISKEQTIAVPFASFNSGMYLVKVDGVTYKIVKK